MQRAVDAQGEPLRHLDQPDLTHGPPSRRGDRFAPTALSWAEHLERLRPHARIDHRRDLARPREVAAPEMSTTVGGNGTARFDDSGFDHVLLAHGVADALEALTPAHREVIEEMYFLDRPVSEVAKRLGVPEGTVKSRAHYALRALRVACEEREILP